MLAAADARVTAVLQAPSAVAGAATAQTASAIPIRVDIPTRTPPFSAEGIPNLRVSVPLSSDADPPQVWHAPADVRNVARERESTTSGRDRLAERTLIIAVIALLAVVTGISVWAQRATGAQADMARTHVRALQASEASAADFAAAATKAARRRALNRVEARLVTVAPGTGVSAAQSAVANERRALALPASKAAVRAQRRAGARLQTALGRLSAGERKAATVALTRLNVKQERAWEYTLAAFPSGLLVLGALLFLLRVIRRRTRAGTDAKLAHLEHAATTDPLTGLRNRRTFDDDLARALAKGRVCLVMLDLDGLKQTNERLGHAVGDERIRAVSAALRSADTSALGYRLGGDEFAAILAGVGADAGHRFAHRVQDAMRVQHGGDEPSVAVGVAVGELRTPTADLMRRADTALLAAKRMTSQIRVHSPELDIASLETMGGRRQGDLATALAAAVDAKDGDGYDHSRTVAELAAGIAALVGLSRDQAEQVRIAGLLHDVGYLDVDDLIFAKGEEPTDAEWDELAAHAERGARILARCGFGEIATWVRHHHERVDGAGYPGGLAGDAIPLESRVLHVADAYEAMTRGHSYQTRMTAEAALAEIERLAGSQFDTQCVAALRRSTAAEQAA
jgi:diguanylate cyclase (GGDEF)-like protein/putative nucleotidyltransferase with HDIG domain